MQSSSTSAIIRVHLSFSPEHTLTIKNHNRPALMLDERSPCGNFPFRTVCCESITPYFESVTISCFHTCHHSLSFYGLVFKIIKLGSSSTHIIFMGAERNTYVNLAIMPCDS